MEKIRNCAATNIRVVHLENALRKKILIGSVLLAFEISAVEQAAALPTAESRNLENSTTDYQLDVIAYNYTDKTIGSYSVDGAWVGDVILSSPTSGGSGTGCCFMLPKKLKSPVRVTIRWQIGGCRYYVKSPSSNYMYGKTHYYYKEQIIPVQLKSKINPNHLAIHFFPDGSVQAHVTDELDLPLISLPEGRIDKSSFPRCSNGEHEE